MAKKQQPQVKRVSFVVRLEVDEHNQPRRTEIEETQSRKKQNYLGLDGELLVSFIKACMGIEHAISTVPPAVPPVEARTPTAKAVSKSRKTHPAPSGDVQGSTEASVARQALTHSVKRRHVGKTARHPRGWKSEPTAPPFTVTADRLSDHSAPIPSPPRPKASLIVSDIQVFRLAVPDFMTFTLKSAEPFMVKAHFQLLGPEARSLTALEPSYEMKVYAKEIASRRSWLLETVSSGLIRDVLEYTMQAEIPGFPPGFYSLSTAIILGPPVMVGGFLGEIIIQVL